MGKNIVEIIENAGALKESFKKGGRAYTQMKRNSLVALYEVKEKSITYYEVFKICSKKSKKVELSGGVLTVKDGEAYPSPKKFGNLAYCCKTFEQAIDRFDEINQKLASRIKK
jgi:hypothetical protein